MNDVSRHRVASPQAFGLSHDTFGRLVLIDAEGRRHVGVTPHRAFPISDPHRGISICDADGHEIRWIDSFDDLSPAVRQTLQDELARRDFLPVVRRIVRVSGDIEPSEWVVETDRGETKFVLNSEDNVRRLENHGAMIVDAHGIRYLITDVRALDTPSRRILERYL
jgi:hypothetical protein